MLPAVPSILTSAVAAADETRQATVAVPLVLPRVGVTPSVGVSAPAVAAAQRYMTEPDVVAKSAEAELVQFRVTRATPAVPLVAVAPVGEALSMVTVVPAVSVPVCEFVPVHELILAVTE